MNNAPQLAQHYFDLSNSANLEEIRGLFTASSTYSSANTGLYLGVGDIMGMQEKFFARFRVLGWQIHSNTEVKPGIALLDFTFTGELIEGETVTMGGLEYVVVYNGKLQHVEIRSKE